MKPIAVSETGLFKPFMYQKRTFYQDDRLGTNMGKAALKNRRFFVLLQALAEYLLTAVDALSSADDSDDRNGKHRHGKHRNSGATTAAADDGRNAPSAGLRGLQAVAAARTRIQIQQAAPEGAESIALLKSDPQRAGETMVRVQSTSTV
eukprot:COSAG06_NODE_1112_length_10647_cov_8.424820_5_plen_149_part_00